MLHNTKQYYHRLIVLLVIVVVVTTAHASIATNEYLLKDPAVKALYLRATETWFTEEGLKKGDSLLAIGRKQKSDIILALAAEVRENYMFANGTDEQYYKASDVLQRAMKKAGLTRQYFNAIYSAVVYDCNHGQTIKGMRRASQMQNEAKRSKDRQAIFLSLRCSGIVYSVRGNYSLAADYFNKSIAYAKENLKEQNLGVIYADLSSLYFSNGEYEKGVKAADMVFRNADDDPELLVDGYSKRCHNLYELNRHEEFMSDYAHLETLLKEYPEFAEYEECVWAKGLYLVLKGKYEEARKVVYSTEDPEDSLSIDITIARKKGDYKTAFELSQRLYEVVKMETSDLDQKEIVEMSRQLGITKLQNEADLLNTRHQRMIYMTIIFVIVVVMIVVVMGIIYRSRQRVVRHQQKIQEERELFYRNVTHQLRTPMTVVLGMVNQIKSHLKNGEKVEREEVEAAERQSNNLLQLIKQLITASKDGALDKVLTSSQGDIVMGGDSAAVQPSAVSGSSFAALSNGGTNSILVAEDNDDVALLICNMLHDEGYSVTRAVDGLEAWEMLQEQLPDLLMTDIAMPRMDGLQLMQHVRQDDTMSHLPIVVVSARVEDSERMEGISAGAEVYLAKPFINEELLLRVRKLLEQRELLKKRVLENVGQKKETTEPETEAVETQQDMNEEERAFMNRINTLIDDNMESGNVTADFLKDSVGMSISTLNRKMKNLTGMSATLYIRRRRISVAKYLLETTDKQISEIEEACGFTTAGHFSKFFKAETGMTPSEYRARK